jgi:hypothetical protein
VAGNARANKRFEKNDTRRVRTRPQQRTHAIPQLIGENQLRCSTKGCSTQGDCMSYATILAIDLGKFKSVLCIMDVATRTHRFLSIESTPQLIRQTVQQHRSPDPSQTQVVFETCDTCGWVHDSIVGLTEHAREIADCPVDELWRGRLKVELQLMDSINQQLKVLDAKLDELADPRMKLLQTLKGVGPRTAEAVVLYVDDPKRFKSGEELASYAGLVPKQMQSGEMNRLGHITHRGPGLLRSMLVESAWTIYRFNVWAQVFVNKISHGSKARRKLAIVALAKKVLIILWGMLKSNQPFRPPMTTAPAS